MCPRSSKRKCRRNPSSGGRARRDTTTRAVGGGGPARGTCGPRRTRWTEPPRKGHGWRRTTRASAFSSATTAKRSPGSSTHDGARQAS